MAELEYKVKKEFVLLYSDSEFLNNFHDRIIQSITDNQYKIKYKNNKAYVHVTPEDEPLEIPSLPQLGDLDIENIVKSKYMIS
jgi:DNA-directed RNA polymerase